MTKHINNTVKLWTFQSVKAVESLKSNGVLTSNWNSYPPASYFKLAYEWMAREMAKRTIHCEPYAPIWAWHSCGGYQEPPKLLDARGLLSDVQLIEGIMVIEFHCPQQLVLLSNYGVWGVILNDFADGMNETVISPKLAKKLFTIPTRHMGKDKAVQATLPYLMADWVIDIRPLKLLPDNWDFDPNELV